MMLEDRNFLVFLVCLYLSFINSMLLPWQCHESKPKPKDVWKWEGIQDRLLLHLTANKAKGINTIIRQCALSLA